MTGRGVMLNPDTRHNNRPEIKESTTFASKRTYEDYGVLQLTYIHMAQKCISNENTELSFKAEEHCVII